MVQALPSLQVTVVPGTQAPAPQRSPLVQASSSSQGAVLLVWAQPVAGLQESVVQRLVSSQDRTAPLLQVPALHTSPLVQALPSSQAPACGVLTQPRSGSQESVVQALESSQLTVAPETQEPAAQRSPLVQALPSSHRTVLLA